MNTLKKVFVGSPVAIAATFLVGGFGALAHGGMLSVGAAAIVGTLTTFLTVRGAAAMDPH